MATRMQQRRGTAAQWISTNSGNGPILNAGEIGYETDTNKFKIGDGTNHWVDLVYFSDAEKSVAFTTNIVFEGATADSYETTLAVTDPTADRTITLPDASGTVALTSDIAELSQDAIDTALTAGTGITKTYNDSANTLTLAVDTTAIQARVTGVSDTEIGYLDGVTSAIQTQMNAKAPLASPTFTGTVTLPSGTVTSTMIADGTIATADIADSAVTSAKIANDTIVDADINSAAAIAWTKIAPSSTVSSTELGYLDGVTSAIQTQMDTKAPLAAPAFTGTATAVNLTISGDLTVNGTTTNLNSTNLVIEDKNIVLADVATPTNTTADGAGITVNGTTNKTFNWVNANTAWTSSENLDLASGKTFKINATDVLSSSALGSGVTGSSLTSVGTIATGTWSATEIAVAKGGTGATTAGAARTNLGATTVGANVFTLTNPSALSYVKVASDNTVSAASASTVKTDLSLNNVENTAVSTWAGSTNITTLGTVATGTWSATTIALNKGGTGATTQAGAANAVLPAQTSNSGKYLTTDGTNVSWGTVSSYSAPTLGSTSIASGATVTTIAGLTLSGATLTGTLTANSSAGTSGQVLSSTGSGVQWITPTAGADEMLVLMGAY